jgi:hypothetical protein
LGCLIYSDDEDEDEDEGEGEDEDEYEYEECCNRRRRYSTYPFAAFYTNREDILQAAAQSHATSHLTNRMCCHQL